MVPLSASSNVALVAALLAFAASLTTLLVTWKTASRSREANAIEGRRNREATAIEAQRNRDEMAAEAKRNRDATAAATQRARVTTEQQKIYPEALPFLLHLQRLARDYADLPRDQKMNDNHPVHAQLAELYHDHRGTGDLLLLWGTDQIKSTWQEAMLQLQAALAASYIEPAMVRLGLAQPLISRLVALVRVELHVDQNPGS